MAAPRTRSLVGMGGIGTVMQRPNLRLYLRMGVLVFGGTPDGVSFVLWVVRGVVTFVARGNDSGAPLGSGNSSAVDPAF